MTTLKWWIVYIIVILIGVAVNFAGGLTFGFGSFGFFATIGISAFVSGMIMNRLNKL
ncbi:hypothetical protein [Candidatus Phycosocius spiralis]|uniref:DUF1328 domain-containing protein n=1 Tax=Candidatus Phycosocius spiralis TaxID=2815099 RepID=A0ABQ4PU55_9PROT|nr:hypothetical protein [Candidatus Phycosocius spiralis]GIU66547.1 hypothetical protein PsB1_0701 [Candidatus Phycosocius spiralis]